MCVKLLLSSVSGVHFLHRIETWKQSLYSTVTYVILFRAWTGTVPVVTLQYYFLEFQILLLQNITRVESVDDISSV